MRFNLSYIFCLLFLIPKVGTSQDKKNKLTEDNFEHYGYMVDMSTYEELTKQGLSDEKICKNLGNTAYLKAEYQEATYWYAKLFELKNTSIETDYLYRYAQALKSTKDYEGSVRWMKKFRKKKENDIRAQKHNKDVEYFMELMAPSEEYTVENLTAINSKESDFAPSFYNNDLVFSTARDLETTSRTTTPYLNLYTASNFSIKENSTPSPFSEELKSLANESSTSFSKDGKTIYFTRNNYKKGSFGRDKKGISRLKIYRATLKDGIWGNIEDLPFNSDKYSVAHPALNSDGTKLYFSSDMPGTLGASDIFVATINADGSFGQPENLGPQINTESKETFPFISDSGILYFASDGHPGLGGLDLFSIDLQKKDSVKNLGNPINSPNDDFSLIFDEKTNSGFFASNRAGGVGNDDIYYLKTIDCTVDITGIAVDKDSNKALPNTHISVLDASESSIGETFTNEEGAFKIEVPCQENGYNIVGNLDGYEESLLPLPPSEDNKELSNVRLEMEETSKVAVVGADLVKVLKLDPIYFDLNSSYLRKDAFENLDKVVAYMQKRPEVKIEVGSHTDSREEDNYNLWLSERRAQRTVDYIISKGIDNSRVTGKGYGETQLINRCANGVKCSDKEHQLNRRSEFIIRE
ncbi:OmpA family protein [Maribacter sp. MMG018]|uniref:OmpA family protein n=1 Tax=Maribacter sp. MMG018 TaxID=2822688 RepID=UPI001B373047|nr:OmpA family protein [Maribacter sp. MMG018]MBQ4914415.1 OmpA family protein [Maribacter sp. MMG018]